MTAPKCMQAPAPVLCKWRALVMQVWDIATMECVKTLTGHSGPVRTLVYSGGRMFSGSYDKTVRVWDVDHLTCLSTLQGAHPLF